MEITLELPKRLIIKLKKLSRVKEKTLEELISEAIFKRFNITDPEVKAELHLKLCQKYIREAEDFLAKKTMFKLLRRSGVQHHKLLRL